VLAGRIELSEPDVVVPMVNDDWRKAEVELEAGQRLSQTTINTHDRRSSRTNLWPRSLIRCFERAGSLAFTHH